MTLMKLFLIAVGLSMDAFGVSICKGLACAKLTLKHCLVVGLWFGSFQALMPLIGYILGTQFEQYIVSVDHWIAFGLLFLIGINMIREAIKEVDSCPADDSIKVSSMFILAIATSIDALAVGVTFAFLHVSIVPAISFIGIITFILSALGVKIGNVCGEKYKKTAAIGGGVILILIGARILLEHLGIFA